MMFLPSSLLVKHLLKYLLRPAANVKSLLKYYGVCEKLLRRSPPTLSATEKGAPVWAVAAGGCKGFSIIPL